MIAVDCSFQLCRTVLEDSRLIQNVGNQLYDNAVSYCRNQWILSDVKISDTI
jgi:hypothetical protein